jgi:hypothetical protein
MHNDHAYNVTALQQCCYVAYIDDWLGVGTEKVRRERAMS